MFLTLKKNAIVVFLLFITIFSITVFSYNRYFKNNEVSVNANTVIIDAGHGGEDGGAVGKNGTLEKNLNLSIALKLKKHLVENGISVQMTRETDTMLTSPDETKNKKRSDLNNRVKISRKFDNALFVSIHMNSYESANEKGAQIFYSKNNEQSSELASYIENELKEKVDSKNKRVSKPAGSEIFILKHITLPACLIECGFISNREEEELLSNEIYQEKLAEAIASGIKKYMLNSSI